MGKPRQIAIRIKEMQESGMFWDSAAKSYAKSPIKDMASYEYTTGRTKTYLKKSDRVLELGCGTGSTALLLSDNVAQITASDISKNMIAIAEQKASEQGIENIKFVTSDVSGIASGTDTYEVVLALNLIHLIEDAPGAIRQISSLVKPGGYFISKTVCKPGKGTPFKLRLLLMVLPLMQFFGKAPFVNFMEIEELENHITQAGFRIIETGNHPVAPPSRYIVAQKLSK